MSSTALQEVVYHDSVQSYVHAIHLIRRKATKVIYDKQYKLDIAQAGHSLWWAYWDPQYGVGLSFDPTPIVDDVRAQERLQVPVWGARPTLKEVDLAIRRSIFRNLLRYRSRTGLKSRYDV